VLAVLNDTTGCLMSCAWKNPTAEVGVIVGKKMLPHMRHSSSPSLFSLSTLFFSFVLLIILLNADSWQKK
jgi:hypothetical protein